MRLSAVMACNVILTCATIHNIEIQNGNAVLHEGVIDVPFVSEDLGVNQNQEEDIGGREILTRIISHFA